MSGQSGEFHNHCLVIKMSSDQAVLKEIVHLLGASGVTTSDLDMFNEFGGKIFRNAACYAFKGQHGTTEIKLTCHREPVEFL